MPHTRSAQKHLRKIRGRTLRNREVKSRLKTLSKKVKSTASANESGDFERVSKEFTSALDKATKTGLVHPNKVARHKSKVARMASKARNTG